MYTPDGPPSVYTRTLRGSGWGRAVLERPSHALAEARCLYAFCLHFGEQINASLLVAVNSVWQISHSIVCGSARGGDDLFAFAAALQSSQQNTRIFAGTLLEAETKNTSRPHSSHGELWEYMRSFHTLVLS